MAHSITPHYTSGWIDHPNASFSSPRPAYEAASDYPRSCRVSACPRPATFEREGHGTGAGFHLHAGRQTGGSSRRRSGIPSRRRHLPDRGGRACKKHHANGRADPQAGRRESLSGTAILLEPRAPAPDCKLDENRQAERGSCVGASGTDSGVRRARRDGYPYVHGNEGASHVALGARARNDSRLQRDDRERSAHDARRVRHLMAGHARRAGSEIEPRRGCAGSTQPADRGEEPRLQTARERLEWAESLHVGPRESPARKDGAIRSRLTVTGHDSERYATDKVDHHRRVVRTDRTASLHDQAIGRG